jgi:TolB protein
MRTITMLLVLGITVVLGGSGTAGAAWPGESGRVAFTRDGDIYTMAPDGTDLKRLTDSGFESDPAWSPDGEWLAFSSVREKDVGVYVVRADGSGLRRVTDGMDPSWSSDGRQLAFVGSFSLRGLWTIHVDGSNRREVVSDEELDSMPEDPEWSPDGRRIAFSSFDRRTATRNARSDVRVVNADGTGLARAFQPPAGAFDPETFSPSWSPDGSRLAASHFMDGIYVGPVGGPAVRILESGEHPARSPDGSRIVFDRFLSPSREVFSMRSDGTDLARLTVNTQSSVAPDWQRTPGTAPPAGLVRLSNGVVSIPAASVAPRGLVLTSMRTRPWPRRAGSPLDVHLVLRDSRGYAVRGVSVSVRSVPARAIVRSQPARTRADGSASVWLDPRGKARRLVIVLTVRVPGVATSKRLVVRPG